MTRTTVTFDCPCGNPFPVPVVIGPMTLSGGNVLTADVTAPYEASWEWHCRRFHGRKGRGGPGLPVEVAA